jgi:hypothetical protein
VAKKVTIELGADEEMEKEERRAVDGGKSAWNPSQCAIA